jgi:hypothetical protein
MTRLHMRLRQFNPVQPGETESKTIGCRHGNRLNWGRNGIPNVCALVRGDGICLAPPSSWTSYYRKLVNAREEEGA